MSKVLQALDHSEQHHQTFKILEYGQPTISKSVQRKVPNWLLLTFVCTPAFFGGVAGIYHSYNEQLAAWKISNQPQSQVQQVSFQYYTLNYPSFGTLRETYDFAPPENIKLEPSALISNTISPQQEEKAIVPIENDSLIENLDLSGLSPELALRVESVLDNREASSQSNSDASDLVLNSREWEGKLPPLNFQTHVYSSNPDKRWAKINGTEYREGDWIGDDIQLQNIESQYSVISFNGSEIQVPALYDWQG
ncbi:general secretion pathway protein GspB [Vibrio pectenicida]|uniref:General secretion pathway protein GspB n=1 Tax=Vibrio pectenicida TaxID=62763 RepID=A0A7Y3ZWH5_9VIBR|nr:general secretion pathway protein GspB [Vibrio pectenicida]NOH69789.1 general secretion pathway protein GspB [Vibrio pectenicida]